MTRFTHFALAALAGSQLAAGLNILMLNPSPYGSTSSKAFHNLLKLDENHRVISVSPLTGSLDGQMGVSVDTTPLAEEDFLYFIPEDENSSGMINQQGFTEADLREHLNLTVGDSYYGALHEDQWYVKASLMGSLLFALDHLLPGKYQDLRSIDLIIITPSHQTTLGNFQQSVSPEFQTMKVALQRNIPVLNVNSADALSLEVTSSLEDDGLETSNAKVLTYAQKIEKLLEELSKQSQFGSHNFRSSRALLKSPEFANYMSNERLNGNSRLLPNGVGLNVNLQASSSCMRNVKDLHFIETRSVGGYNKVPSLALEPTTGEFKLNTMFNIDRHLVSPGGSHLSEFSVDENDCVISLTPVSWLGSDYEESDFLGPVINYLNKDNDDLDDDGETFTLESESA